MLYESDKKKMKKYRHVIAALISQSIGYFTPLMALSAIEDYKKKKPNFCEWYFDIAGKRGVRSDEDFLRINHDVIKSAIKNRNGYDFKRCLAIVDRNIAGEESLGASWF